MICRQPTRKTLEKSHHSPARSTTISPFACTTLYPSALRPGQTKPVFAYDLWVEDTYEETIFKILERKQGLYDEVIDSMSAERAPSPNMAFEVADSLFAK